MRPLSGSWLTDIFLGLIVTAAIGGTVSLIVFTVPGTVSVGETVQASAVIGLVVVTIFYVVFTGRMSAAALEDAKASREQADVAKRQLGRDSNAEFIAHVIDPFIEQVQQRCLELKSSKLGWETTTRYLGDIPPERRDLFQSHSTSGGVHVYFVPHASRLDGLPAISSTIGLRRFHEINEDVINELENYGVRTRLWRLASTRLAVEVAEALKPVYERYQAEFLYSSQETNFNLRPYITYVVSLTLIRPDQFGRRSANRQKEYGNTPVAQAKKFYNTHDQEIGDELSDVARLADQGTQVKKFTDALDASLDKINARLNAQRNQLTADYQLSEEYITGFREREQRRQESDLLV